MRKSYELKQEQFDALLALFSPDRETAGEAYERIRQSLTRYFRFKGCTDPDLLADETINRVASKLDGFDPTRNADPAAYFYGFAANILLEHRRRSRRETSLGDGQFSEAVPDVPSDEDPRNTCLHKCMMQLSEGDRKLILAYYQKDGGAKIELRKCLAEELNCSVAALHTKVSRTRSNLRGCIKGCMERDV